MILSKERYFEAVSAGTLVPSRAFNPLFRVSRRALTLLDKQKRMKLHEHFSALRERMPNECVLGTRLAASLALRFSNGYFPAFRYHLGEFLNDEWLACVDWHKQFHRDHVSHQVMCHWVSKELVNACGGDFDFGGKTLKEMCIDQIMKGNCDYLQDYADEMGVFVDVPHEEERRRLIWEWLFDEALFLATMFHDIGYPWQFVHGIVSKFSDHCPQAMSLTTDIGKLYEDYSSRLVCYPLHGYQASSKLHPVAWRKHAEDMLRLGRFETHGMPGAFAFLFLNDVIRDFPEPQSANAKGLFCLEWAAMAIMMHDMQKVYMGPSSGPRPAHPCLRIQFKQDPLSFVMALVDQIQDFCRPSAKFSKVNDKLVGLEYPHACTSVKVTATDGGPMNITYFFTDEGDVIKNRAVFKRDAERDYFDPVNGFLDWTGLPITGVHLGAALASSSDERVKV